MNCIVPLKTVVFRRPPNTILVVCPRRIGDVLLVTPLIRSLKRHWPAARIDVLVFRGTESALEGNRDIHRIVMVSQRAGLRERTRDVVRLWRRYDLACAALSSDRPRFYCWAGGRRRIGLVDPGRLDVAIRAMLHGIALNELATTHTVASSLALLSLLGIAPCVEVVSPTSGRDMAARLRADPVHGPVLGSRPYAVVHVVPQFVYKAWHDAGWQAVLTWLFEQGLAVILSGGARPEERRLTDSIVAAVDGPVVNLTGQLTLGETADVIRGAALFIGPDTCVTHISAAIGCATIALFGPTDPVRWGPWPRGVVDTSQTWPRRGSGRRGNVYLVQGPGSCVPCRGEGCERNIFSLSDCLLNIGSEVVIRAASVMLDLPVPKPGAGECDGAAKPMVWMPRVNRLPEVG